MLVVGSWLLPQDRLDALSGAFDNWTPPEEQARLFIQRRSRSGGGEELLVKGNDGTARIPIVGMMTKEPSFFFDIFGGGSAVYGDIIEAIHTADGDPDVDRIVLDIDSPGGNVEGFFDLARAVRLTKTRIEAEVTDVALSAAYGIAAVTDRITLNNPMGAVGSVGVVTRRFIDEHVVRITSTAAPLKAPDADTPEGIKAIRDELDAIHAEFVAIIAQGRTAALGRTVDEEEVNEEFGRGAVVLGRAAVAAGMIDGIASALTDPGTGPPSPPTGAPEAMAEALSLSTLKTEHRTLYDAIVIEAKTEGHKDGVAAERDRVTAHITAGEGCGNLKLACELIASGDDFSSQNVQARYMGATRTAADDANRREDDDDANAGSGGDAAAQREAERVKAAAGEGGLPTMSDDHVGKVFESV